MIMSALNGVWSDPADHNPKRITKAVSILQKDLILKTKISSQSY